MKGLADTICALSTVPGRSGIAVVRASGPQARNLLAAVTGAGNELPPRRAVLRQIFKPSTSEQLDQALVTWFEGPHSYTGEDVVEFSLHGSPVIASAVLRLLCEQGARLAEPGEFTMRAFLHGRIDLTQAEAVRDIIDSSTLFQSQIALRQQAGELSASLRPAKKRLVDLIVRLESAVEFVEDDLPAESRETIAQQLSDLREDLQNHAESYSLGRVIREGFGMAVVGRPNVGKSSLFNALLERDRSIVAEIPGTTRDLVSESTIIAGVPVHLVDTAGFREADDRVERLGVDRSVRAIADADAVLLVVDGSASPTAEDARLRERLSEVSCILVVNKSDLPPAWSAAETGEFAGSWPVAVVSALTGAGIGALRAGIQEHILGDAGAEREGVLVTNVRQAQCLGRAVSHLDEACRALGAGLSEEFVLHDLRLSLDALGAVTGETGIEDILSEIFSRFCIGK